MAKKSLKNKKNDFEETYSEFDSNNEFKEKQPIKKYAQNIAKIQLTEKQRKLIQIIDNSKITLLKGPAGTAKTFTACYYILDALSKHKFENVVLTKPLEESGEKLGFLPGNIDEKVAPYLESFTTNFKQITPNYIDFFEKNIIKFKPIAYMRGNSEISTLIHVDEAQNLDIRQLILITTRMGRDSKLIISGDISQYDIQSKHAGFDYFTNLIKDINGVATFEFTREDIMRDPILIEITDRYEKAKATDVNFPQNKR